jgi:hypothetical protein
VQPKAFLNTEFRLSIHLGQVVLKDRFGHVDGGKDVGDQTDRQGNGKSPDGPSAK